MAYTGRAPSQAPITSADINDGVVTPADLSTGAPSWDASGNVTVGGNVVLGDSDKAIFGAGSDLQIYHDGSNSYIEDAGTGNLYIDGSNNIILRDQANSDAWFLRAESGAQVSLYHNGNKKLDTTSTGIDVTGTVTADDNIVLDGASSPRLLITDTTNTCETLLQSADTIGYSGTRSNHDFTIVTNNVRAVNFAANNDISFYEDTGTTPKFFWDASAETLNLNNTGTVYGTQLNVKSTATTNTFTSSLASGSGNPRWQFGAGVGSDSGSSTNDKVVRSGLYFDSGYVAGMTYLRGGSATTGYLAFDTDQTERMRINSSGNVGIGTSSPGQVFEVSNSANSEKGMIIRNATNNTTASSILRFYAGTDTAAILRFPSSHSVKPNELYITNVGTTSPITFATQDTERMRIDSSGNLLVGTTSSYGTNPKITVAGGVTISTNSSNYRNIYQSSDTNLYFNNGTNQAYLSSAGSWTNASDARLKTNIRNIEYGLNTVLATQPRHYERIDVNGTYIGFVAQELQDVIPEVVSGDPETQLGVDYGALVAVAFKAIQEQQAMIEALETRIAALESN